MDATFNLCHWDFAPHFTLSRGNIRRSIKYAELWTNCFGCIGRYPYYHPDHHCGRFSLQKTKSGSGFGPYRWSRREGADYGWDVD